MKKLIIRFVLLFIVICMLILSSCSSRLVLYDSENDVKIYGDYLEKGTELDFKYYPYESHLMEQIMEMLKEHNIELGLKGDFYIYEINCTNDGKTTIASDNVEIRIPIPDDMTNPYEFMLCHIYDGEINNIDFEIKGKYLSFKTKTFSYFVFIKKNIGDEFYIAVHSEGPGKVIYDKTKENVEFINLNLGETASFTAIPDKGHTFLGWYYSDDLEKPISYEITFTYKRTDMKEEGFFIYAIFE